MKITVIGAGAIGGNLAAKLSAAGHDVQVADARGPEAVSPEILRTGAHAVDLDNSVKGRDAVILAIPFGVQGQLAELFASVPEDTVVIDTSNYYPGMGGHIESVDNGKAESVYASDLLGRPVTKAWNAALAGTQATKGVPAGTPGRIAIPVAGDNEQARKVAMQLVDDTGFDPYDAGPPWPTPGASSPWAPPPAPNSPSTSSPPPWPPPTPSRTGPSATAVAERIAALPDGYTVDDVVEMNRAAHR
ncbi:NADPH-dependent F420 reductase [Nocardia gipuzkoensis]